MKAQTETKPSRCQFGHPVTLTVTFVVNSEPFMLRHNNTVREYLQQHWPLLLDQAVAKGDVVLKSVTE